MGKKAERREYHAYCQRLHAIQRARERLGLYLEFSDLAVIRSRIEQGVARRLGRTSKTRILYELRFQKRNCRIVYDRSTQEVVTFLTHDMEVRVYHGSSVRGRQLLREEHSRRKPRKRPRIRDCEVFDGADDENV